MAYRGVSTQLPLIKNYWHFNFAINLFALLFLRCFIPVHFFAIPFAKKVHPFFLLIINPKTLLSRLLLCNNFCSSLMNLPIIYIEEIETALLTLLSCVPGFTKGKGSYRA
jgi:hypothetical protein